MVDSAATEFLRARFPPAPAVFRAPPRSRHPGATRRPRTTVDVTPIYLLRRPTAGAAVTPPFNKMCDNASNVCELQLAAENNASCCFFESPVPGTGQSSAAIAVYILNVISFCASVFVIAPYAMLNLNNNILCMSIIVGCLHTWLLFATPAAGFERSGTFNTVTSQVSLQNISPISCSIESFMVYFTTLAMACFCFCIAINLHTTFLGKKKMNMKNIQKSRAKLQSVGSLFGGGTVALITTLTSENGVYSAYCSAVSPLRNRHV